MIGQAAGEGEQGGRRRLAGSLASLLVLQIAGYALPLLAMPLLGRALGPEGLGTFALSVSLAQIGYLVADFGFSVSATDRIARHLGDRELVNRLASQVLACKLALLALLALPTTAFAALSAEPRAVGVVLLTWLLTAALTLQPAWLLQAFGRLASFTLALFVCRAGFVLAIYAMVRDPGDLWLVLGINALSHLAAAAAGWLVVRRLDVRLVPVSPAECLTALARSFSFMLSRAAAASYTSAATALLAIGGAGPHAVGQYAAAEQIYRGLQGLVQPATQALLPFMSSRRDLVLFRRLFWLILALTLAAAIACAMLAEPLMALVFGSGFAESAGLLQLFMLVLVIYVPGVLLGYPFLAAFDRAALANRSVLLAGAAQVAIVAILFATDRLTASTLILSILAAELVVLATRLRWARVLTGRQSGSDQPSVLREQPLSLGGGA